MPLLVVFFGGEFDWVVKMAANFVPKGAATSRPCPWNVVASAVSACDSCHEPFLLLAIKSYSCSMVSTLRQNGASSSCFRIRTRHFTLATTWASAVSRAGEPIKTATSEWHLHWVARIIPCGECGASKLDELPLFTPRKCEVLAPLPDWLFNDRPF